MKSFFLFVILLSLWLLMSGHYTFLIISLGVISCLFCVYLAKRANLIDNGTLVKAAKIVKLSIVAFQRNI